jgi:hypothetical protein
MDSSPKPRPKYLGTTELHPIEHAEEAGSTRNDDLVGSVPTHQPRQGAQAEEPFGETSGSTETI